ncbi:MAG: polysaccharide pyruvyl transferase family protein [Deltaproteobacteria bacterium]|nr:polysaccharide pyruvyl transferase family protein [Deltaproteobacteria bacterium]
MASRRRVLIVPPGPQGGVGDAAVTHMLVQEVRAAGVAGVAVVRYAGDEGEELWGDAHASSYLAAPSWPFDRARWSGSVLAAALADYDDVVIAGNDCIDGGYANEGTVALLECARFAQELGSRVALVNCSFNQRPTSVAVEALRRLPASIPVWLRDAISARSLRAATGRTAYLGAEIAFLVEPRAGDPRGPLEWVRRHAAAGKRVVVLVPNPMVGTRDPLGAPQRDPGPYVAILERLLRLPVGETRVLVAPNDARPAVGDLELVDAIAGALPRACADAVCVSARPLPAALLAETARHAALLVGARFHAVVMALVAGTPVVALEYQDKMRGVLRDCALEDLWVPCAGGLDPGVIVARAEAALARAGAIRGAIAAAVPVLRRRASAMVADVLADGGAPFAG